MPASNKQVSYYRVIITERSVGKQEKLSFVKCNSLLIKHLCCAKSDIFLAGQRNDSVKSVQGPDLTESIDSGQLADGFGDQLGYR